jgi:DNA-binding MarR family transcriptional regulator
MTARKDSIQQGFEAAAAFRTQLRRFLKRTEMATTEAGLSPQRYDLLLAIAAADEAVTISRLCALLDMRQPAVTELVKRAEEAGLVYRAPATVDRRVVLVSATHEGESRLQAAYDALHEDRLALAEALDLLKLTFASQAPQG